MTCWVAAYNKVVKQVRMDKWTIKKCKTLTILLNKADLISAMQSFVSSMDHIYTGAGQYTMKTNWISPSKADGPILHCFALRGLYLWRLEDRGVRVLVIFYVTNSHTNVNPSDWLIRTWPGLLDHTLVGVTRVTVAVSVEERVFYASFLVDCKMDIKCELLQITGFKSELNGPLSLTFSIAAIYTRFGFQLCKCVQKKIYVWSC